MNKIQKTIIKKLLAAPKLRYSQIKPKSMESNLFTYHLRKLIEEGLINKQEVYYSLTAQGKLFVDRLSMETLSPRIQPKIVTMLIVQNELGEYIVYKRKREPFIGKIGFPHGKIHLGESVFLAAKRELKEKTGFETALTHRGEVYVTVFENEELVTHILCHIFVGKMKKEKSQGTYKTARCYWGKIENPHSDLYLPAMGDIYDLVNKNDEYFFAEFVYRL